MQIVYDLLKITLPAALVLYAAFLMVRSMLQKQLEERMLTIRQANQEVVLPIRLQAYERVCLLLERISPNHLIPRVNQRDFTARDLQSLMVEEIRSEYQHNLSQQVYMSDDAWMYVSGAVEQLISLINESANEVGPDASGLDLAKKVLEKNIQNQQDTIRGALGFLKNEIRTMF